VIRRPRESFRKLAVGSDLWVRDRATRFLSLNALLAALLLSVIILVFSRTYWIAGVLTSGLQVMVTYFVLFTLTGVEVLGVVYFSRRRRWRISRAMASEVAGYASAGWLPASLIWGLGGSLVFRATVATARTGRLLLGIYPLRYLLLFVVFFLGLLCFELLVYIGVRQVRYANSPCPNTPNSPWVVPPGRETPGSQDSET